MTETYVVTAEEMRAIDRATIDDLGLPAALLMEHAGRAVAEEVRALSPQRVAVLCGSGNNGGDGHVCARWFREWGIDARVYLAAGPPRAGGEAALHLAVYEKLGGPVEAIADAERLAAATDAITGADVVVDALLGTGLKKAVSGHLAAVIAVANQARGVRVAVDLPSGLDSDTGAVLGVAIAADRTVTLAFPKVGLCSWPGVERAGRVTVADIGIPKGLAPRHGVRLTLTDEKWARAHAIPRTLGGHKGTYGHVLVVAGSPDKPGAALLAARGALRSGAGLVTLATQPHARGAIDGRVPEAMTADLDADAGALALPVLAALLEGKRALVWGPGMSTSAAAGELIEAARAELATRAIPTVFDADALNHLATRTPSLGGIAAVITPHPGEAARLLGEDNTTVQADRVAAARRLAKRWEAVAVLKGARTVVAAPDGRAAINVSGNPGMATGGTGDVLAGVVGTFLAQGLEPFVAARLAVYVHGLAGDLAAAGGEIGMLAGDLAERLPAARVKLT